MPKGAELANTTLNTGVYVESFAYSKNGRRYWNCICPYDQKKFICSSTKLLSKTRPTKSCGCLQKEIAAKILKQNRMDHTIDLTNQKFGKLTVIKRVSKPNNVNQNRQYAFWLCQCECGNTCVVNGTYLRNGDTQSCGCIKSKGEYKIAKILKENKIFFEQQKTFLDCKDKALLPFDFYVNNQYLIEYDGEQHFNKRDFQEDRYNYIQKHDNIKNEYCRNNNIPLIRIPYKHFKNLCIDDLKLETSNFII